MKLGTRLRILKPRLLVKRNPTLQALRNSLMLATSNRALSEGFPFNERHDVVEEPVNFSGIEERKDVRVL